jgi:hypothetical protein
MPAVFHCPSVAKDTVTFNRTAIVAIIASFIAITLCTNTRQTAVDQLTVSLVMPEIGHVR